MAHSLHIGDPLLGDVVMFWRGNVYNIVSFLSARFIKPVKAHCQSSF